MNSHEPASPIPGRPAASLRPLEQTGTVPMPVPVPDGEVQPDPEEPEMDLEPIVKSPPEPTRVKSPEQIILRSPEPVNWTVPLDTGKTFTVTHNVPDGGSRGVTPPRHGHLEKAAFCVSAPAHLAKHFTRNLEVVD